jgi:mercuric ion transport protein
MLLMALGIGGAWGSRVVALEAYQPWFVGAALLFFGYAFFKLYRSPEACAPGEACAIPAVRRRQRVIFWVVAALAAALMSLPLYAPFFY